METTRYVRVRVNATFLLAVENLRGLHRNFETT